MKNKEIFIFLTAYSPRWNIIASKRIENLSKYVSKYFKTYIVAGIPNNIDEKYLKDAYDIGSSKLIEIPSIYSKNSSNEKKNKKEKAIFIKFERILKIEALPFLEMFFPVSPGQTVLHNQNKFVKEIKNIIEKNYQASKIYLFASYGPSFIIKIANKIKKHFKDIELIIDFRDWAYKYYEGFLYNTPIYKYYTKSLIRKADRICFVSKVMKEYYEKNLVIKKPTFFLPNGFDKKYENLTLIDFNKELSKKEFKIVYTGSIHFKMINPEIFLNALNIFVNNNNCIKTKFIYAGKNEELISMYVKKYNLENYFESKGFLKYEDTLKLQKDADLLLLLAYTGKNKEIGKSIITGKFYEYLSSGKPILVIGPDEWEMKEIIELDNVSRVVPNNVKAIIEFLENYFENIEKFNLNSRKKVLENFNYKNISTKLIKFVRGDI